MTHQIERRKAINSPHDQIRVISLLFRVSILNTVCPASALSRAARPKAVSEIANDDYYGKTTPLRMLLDSILTLRALISHFSPWQRPFELLGQPGLRTSQPQDISSPPKRIAVVGAGTAGLSFLKVSLGYQRERDVNWEVVLYEQRHDIGGVWLEQVVKPEPPLLPETPLYPNLRTNSPHPVNTFPNFPFPAELDLFPGAQSLYQYHKDVVAHYNLTGSIHLRHNVTTARWFGNATHGHWGLTIQRPRKTCPSGTMQNPTHFWCSVLQGSEHDLETIYENFDHLIVAPVKTDDWLLKTDPESPFRRDIRHSIYFNGPEPYVNRTVLIAGGSVSGMDIGNHITPFAAKAYIARSAGMKGDPSNHFLIPKPRLSHFDRDAIYFEDGSSVTDVDSVILATGYRYIVPFLIAGNALVIDPNARSHNTSHIHPPPLLRLTSNGKYMHPLYKHTMSLSSYFPPSSLFVFALPRIPPPALGDSAQAIFATRVIADPSLVANRISLLRELEEDEERLRRAGYDPDKRAHTLVDLGDLGQASNLWMESLIDFLKERNVTGLPLPGSGGRYVDDWRRKHGDLRALVGMLFTWREVEKRGESEKLLAGRRTEKDWAELLDYLETHPLPPTPIEVDPKV
ncbi:uncharacterized protein EI90DRAFT_3060806 [Cantharellus anzutake]|uniref:uncharacterized protein n=1 Tax=Cantharellus anzutake TaxID=1750568 RepID=UPI0019068577|nr:uncharacterized protein EI90DRAFT_3060806 [Cantharellus anzutake]KAF8330455.1 hypothetical protein EI90DRAFT_3060806 [Cantharellus anzutake]